MSNTALTTFQITDAHAAYVRSLDPRGATYYALITKSAKAARKALLGLGLTPDQVTMTWNAAQDMMSLEDNSKAGA